MATTALTSTSFGYVAGGQGVNITPGDLTAFPNANTGVTFQNTGHEVLFVNNGTASPITVQPVLQRSVQGQTPTIPAASLPASKFQVYGPWPTADFGTAMTVNITAGATGVTVGLFGQAYAPGT